MADELVPRAFEYQTENHELRIRVHTIMGSRYVWITLYPVHKGNFPPLMYERLFTVEQARALVRFLSTNVRRYIRRNAGDGEEAIDLSPNDLNRLVVVVNERDVKQVVSHIQAAIDYSQRLVLKNA